MEKGYRRCMRCIGKKRIFKIMSGYSHINSGGIEVDCPMCLGKGTIKTLESMMEEVVKKELNNEEENKSPKRGRPKKEEKGEGQFFSLQSNVSEENL